MAEITAALVKELREKSGSGMMDCKKALTETGGDIEAGMDWLRTKGLSKAAKKADRIAAEGLIAIALRTEGGGMTGAVVEVNAETDFVARNDRFQTAARAIAKTALDVEGGVDKLAEARTEGGETVNELLTGLIATIGENMTARRMARFVVSEGAVAAYVHNAVAPELGRIGVLVALQSSANHEKLTDIGRKIGMHIAATSPLSLSVDDIDPAAVDRERAIFSEQAQASGKPPQVIEKMVEGRIRKFYEEVVLLKQAFVMNPDQTIEQFLAEQGKTLGASIQLTGFVRLALGEGVEKGKDDFAGEVAALTGQ